MRIWKLALCSPTVCYVITGTLLHYVAMRIWKLVLYSILCNVKIGTLLHYVVVKICKWAVFSTICSYNRKIGPLLHYVTWKLALCSTMYSSCENMKVVTLPPYVVVRICKWALSFTKYTYVSTKKHHSAPLFSCDNVKIVNLFYYVAVRIKFVFLYP